VSSVPGTGERVEPSADVGAGTVTAYFVDNGRLGVLVRLELYPDKNGPDFHFSRPFGRPFRAACFGPSPGLKPSSELHFEHSKFSEENEIW
jgi:hypothetical protein